MSQQHQQSLPQQQQPSAHPTLINLPPAPSNPDTPSEMPGTPTSTTTSLSALSTTAIKDGHRGSTAGAHHHPGSRHQHNSSMASLEDERADRISRLAGLSNLTTLRAPGALHNNHHQPSSPSHSPQQTTPTSTTGFFHHHNAYNNNLNPATAPIAYFDAAGQPRMQTKMSTVGTASATESVAGRTETGTAMEEEDEDMMSGAGSVSASASVGAGSGYVAGDEDMMMGGDGDDRMSDDGRESLVGFGEGAGSTVSGPIYHRRVIPGMERSGSGLSETLGALSGGSGRRAGEGSDTPVSQTAMRERREARMVDGVALDGSGAGSMGVGVPVTGLTSADDDVFVDTTTRGPVPVQAAMSAIRETQQPGSHQHLAQAHYMASRRGSGGYPAAPSSPREAAEYMMRERFDVGDNRALRGDVPVMGSPRGGERLGRFYFEDR